MVTYNFDYISSKDKPYFEERVSKSCFIEQNLLLRDFAESYVLPYCPGLGEGGVLDSQKHLVGCSTLHEELQSQLYKFEENQVQYVDEDVLFVGNLYSVYGHAITDNLKKIWFLYTEEFQYLMSKGVKLIYITFHGQELESYVFDIFRLAGCDVSKAKRIDTITKFRKIYIPDNSMILSHGRRLYTIEFKQTIERIKNSVGQKQYPIYEKVYLSRTAINQKRDYGELYVERLFEKVGGYTILHPEKLSIEEQVYIAMHCKCLAATVGSVSHTAIFCAPQTQLIELQKANYINGYQVMIEHLIEGRVTYIDANHTLPLKYPWGGPFFMAKTRYLANYFQIHFFDLYFLRREWYKYLTRYFHIKISNLIHSIHD